MSEEYLSIRQVAALVGCEPYSVNRAIREGRLPATRVAGFWIIRRVDAEQYRPRRNKEKVTG